MYHLWSKLIVFASCTILWSLFQYRHRAAARKGSFDSSTSSEVPSDLVRTQTFEAVHIKLNLETGAMLPLALRYVCLYKNSLAV